MERLFLGVVDHIGEVIYLTLFFDLLKLLILSIL